MSATTVTGGHVVSDFVNSDHGQVNIGDHYHNESIVIESLITGNTFVWQSSDAKPRTIYDWFSTIKYWLNHENMCKDLHPDTGSWLLNRKEFLQWKSADRSSVLWLHGIPGSGKSKLVAHVINHMKPLIDASTTPLAYFYCLNDAAEEERSRPEEVIRSILRQLSFCGGEGGQERKLKSPAAEMYQLQKDKAKDHGSETVDRLTLQQSVELLVSLLEGSSTTIIIDAIDELKADDRWKLFEAFDLVLAQVKHANVKLFVSSRDNGDIKSKLSQYANIFIEATDNEEDIRKFVNVEVGKAILYHRILPGAVSDELKNDIITTLIQRAGGMFRWVSLSLQALCSPRIKKESSVRKALGNLPATLEALYDVVYTQILELEEDDRLTAENAMKWLLCAKTQLRSSEFISAISVRRVDDESSVPEKGLECTVDELLDICSNLIVLDETIDTFRPAHLSVREYFEKRAGYQRLEIHTFALETCIDTLMIRTKFDWAYADFKKYANFFWAEHCQEIGADGPIDPLSHKLKSFLLGGNGSSPYIKNWADQVNAELEGTTKLSKAQWRKLRDSAMSPSDPVFLASSYGLLWLLKDLLKIESFDRDRRLSYGDTGMSLATVWGYRAMVEEFLNHGTDVCVPGAEGRTPLHIAAEHGHGDLLQYLISKGADICRKWDSGRTPLHEAVHWGQHAMAKILLDNGADTACADKNGETVLITAVLRDRVSVPGYFYDGSSFINTGNRETKGGLFYAADILRLLLDYGANIYDPANRSALLAAVKASRTNAVNVLLESGIDINFADEGGKRSLDLSLEFGLSEIIGILAAHGASPGLKWEKNSYHISQWKEEAWYPDLLKALESSSATAPAPFIPMPDAEGIRLSREYPEIITKDSPDVPYLFIRIPSTITSVISLTVTTESFKRYTSTKESTSGQPPWFEAAIISNSGREVGSLWWQGDDLEKVDSESAGAQGTEDAEAKVKYHKDITSIEAQTENASVREWVTSLRPGDVVQVFAKAKYAGWAIHVRRVEVEIQGVHAVSLPRRPTIPK